MSCDHNITCQNFLTVADWRLTDSDISPVLFFCVIPVLASGTFSQHGGVWCEWCSPNLYLIKEKEGRKGLRRMTFIEMKCFFKKNDSSP